MACALKPVQSEAYLVMRRFRVRRLVSKALGPGNGQGPVQLQIPRALPRGRLLPGRRHGSHQLRPVHRGASCHPPGHHRRCQGLHTVFQNLHCQQVMCRASANASVAPTGALTGTHPRLFLAYAVSCTVSCGTAEPYAYPDPKPDSGLPFHAEDPADQEATVLQSLKGPTEKGRFQRVAWTDLNRTLISAGEDGCVRRWDVEVGCQHGAVARHLHDGLGKRSAKYHLEDGCAPVRVAARMDATVRAELR